MEIKVVESNSVNEQAQLSRNEAHQPLLNDWTVMGIKIFFENMYLGFHISIAEGKGLKECHSLCSVPGCMLVLFCM